MYWDKTITLFNRTEDTITGVVSWYKHILHKCFVKRTNVWVRIGAVNGQRSNDIIDKYKLDGVIRINSVNENTFLPNKHYLIMGE